MLAKKILTLFMVALFIITFPDLAGSVNRSGQPRYNSASPSSGFPCTEVGDTTCWEGEGCNCGNDPQCAGGTCSRPEDLEEGSEKAQVECQVELKEEFDRCTGRDVAGGANALYQAARAELTRQISTAEQEAQSATDPRASLRAVTLKRKLESFPPFRKWISSNQTDCQEEYDENLKTCL